MKKLLLIFVVLSSLVAAGGCSYAYFIYIPKKVEQKIINSLNGFGFENLNFGKITRQNGHILFSNISLDKQQFSTIGALSVHYSLFKFLLNPDHAQKIIIKNLSLTGELSKNLNMTISGWNNDKDFLQNVRNIPATYIIVEKSNIDLLSEDIGGIKINYNGQIHLSAANNITIKGHISSKQKKLAFQAKLNGDISPDGNLSMDAEMDQIAISQDNLSIRRGAASVKLMHSISKNAKLSLSIESDLASVNWQNLPLRDVHATFEGSAGNYNFAAEGTTFGSEHIEWEGNINKVNNIEKAEINITPAIFSDFLSFLERNKRLKESTTFPGFLLNLKEPTLSINTAKRYNTPIEGTFKIMNTLPDFEIDGNFIEDENTKNIEGSFSIEDTNITSEAEEDNSNIIGFQISSLGKFIINNNTQIATLGWSSDTKIEDGHINYGALIIPKITGKFSYRSKAPKKTKDYLSFKLPLVSNILQSGRIRLNLLDKTRPLFKSIALNIYGGQIKTKKQILKDHTLITSNTLSVSDINLTQLFHDAGFKNVIISGQLGGVIPLKINHKKMIVNGGILQSQGGGIIRLPENIITGLFPGNSRKMFMIRKALQNYHYEFFEIRLDGDLTGRVMMTLSANGYNPDFKGKEPVDLNLQIETQISLLFDKLLK